MTEKLTNQGKPKHTFNELFELALKFLSNPRKLWTSGDIAPRNTVLRLAFCRNEGFRTPQITEPFRFLGLSTAENEMVHPARFERATSAFGGQGIVIYYDLSRYL